VIAQAEVKTIMKSSGERYKKLRESGQTLVGSGADPRTSGGPVKINLDGSINGSEEESKPNNN
jgi:molybdopterin-containing oxidoreductase family membrane subunit